LCLSFFLFLQFDDLHRFDLFLLAVLSFFLRRFFFFLPFLLFLLPLFLCFDLCFLLPLLAVGLTVEVVVVTMKNKNY